MKKKHMRIIGCAMFILATMFVIFATKHPEMGFPWDNTVTYMLYKLYVIIMVILIVCPFKERGDD